MKGLYGMLGLEYRDTDSEEEGGTSEFDNGEADCSADGDYVVIDLGGKGLFDQHGLYKVYVVVCFLTLMCLSFSLVLVGDGFCSRFTSRRS